MDFNANQIKKDLLLPDGQYPFVVLDAKEKVSQSGFDMLCLKLALIVGDRRVVHWVNLMLMPKMFWMIEHFCKSTGMPEKIELGRLTADDCFGKEGVLLLEQKANFKTGDMENATKDFVKPEEVAAAAEPAPAPAAPSAPENFFNDDIPDLVA